MCNGVICIRHDIYVMHNGVLYDVRMSYFMHAHLLCLLTRLLHFHTSATSPYSLIVITVLRLLLRGWGRNPTGGGGGETLQEDVPTWTVRTSHACVHTPTLPAHGACILMARTGFISLIPFQLGLADDYDGRMGITHLTFNVHV
jgi:hypothetical protein